ncbi:histidine kinase, partial [Streptomyces sp. 15-116A]|nr:histidine kinase [Streptomyces sp. 15-116A]
GREGAQLFPGLPQRNRRRTDEPSGPAEAPAGAGRATDDVPAGAGRATDGEAAADGTQEQPDTGRAPSRTPDAGASQPGTAALPRRVRQASLAPQLKRSTGRRDGDNTSQPVERDAEEVRSRMASLQRGWQRGREENAAGDDIDSGTAPQGTTKGDGR